MAESDTTLDELAQRIENALDESIDRCARCKTCSHQVNAVTAVIEDEAINRMAAQFVEESRFRAMNVRDGSVVLEMQPAREIIAMWIGSARTVLDGAANYVEMDISLAGTGEAYTFRLERREGKTPHQLRKEADARAEAAEARLAEVHEWAGTLPERQKHGYGLGRIRDDLLAILDRQEGTEGQ